MIEKAESIESKYHVDYVDSGLPRQLIETAFVLLQQRIMLVNKLRIDGDYPLRAVVQHKHSDDESYYQHYDYCKDEQ